MYIVDHPTVVV